MSRKIMVLAERVMLYRYMKISSENMRRCATGTNGGSAFPHAGQPGIGKNWMDVENRLRLFFYLPLYL